MSGRLFLDISQSEPKSKRPFTSSVLTLIAQKILARLFRTRPAGAETELGPQGPRQNLRENQGSWQERSWFE
jgi:hypothetical protein